MNFLDIIVLLLLAYAFLQGFFKGFVIELASVLMLLFGVYVAVVFSGWVGSYLSDNSNEEIQKLSRYAFIISFMLLLIGVYFMANLLTKMLKLVALGLLNKIGGGVLSVVKIVIVLSVLSHFLWRFNQSFSIINPDTLEDSLTFKLLIGFADEIFPSLQEWFTNTKSEVINHL